jgi:hypothetical protein
MVVKRKLHKKLIGQLVSILFLVIITGGSLIYINRYLLGKVTFQEYAPTYLPKGVTMQRKSIQALYIPSDNPAHFTMISIELTNGFIYLQKKPKNSNIGCPHTPIVHEMCNIRLTPRGEHYVMITQINRGGSVESQSVDLIKGDTKIRLHFNVGSKAAYAQPELERIIDSFAPVHYRNLPVQYIDRSKV